jgi:hypothetical protein
MPLGCDLFRYFCLLYNYHPCHSASAEHCLIIVGTVVGRVVGAEVDGYGLQLNINSYQMRRFTSNLFAFSTITHIRGSILQATQSLSSSTAEA